MPLIDIRQPIGLCDFLLIDSNRGRITYCLRDIFSSMEIKNNQFRPMYFNCKPLAEECPAIST